MPDITSARIRSAYETAKAALLAEMVSKPVSADDPVQKLLDAPVSEMRHWVGELSTSALSTATAVMALEQMRRQYVAAARDVPEEWLALIRGGINWLIAHQNEDGGWGDTVKSISNISTTMLCRATLCATADVLIPKGSQPLAGGRSVAQPPGREPMDASHPGGMPEDSNAGIPPGCEINSTIEPGVSDALRPPANVSQSLRDKDNQESIACVLASAQAYIDRTGGVPAVIARYGKDRTFSVPILTHCALAGLVDWDDVISLPFELACLPPKFYAAVKLPVVSYALPALIAIGQVRFHFRPSKNPLRRWLQKWAVPRSLRVLESIQPPNGGFLEATPLTSFVTMSLAAMGLHDHPVAKKGIEFIVASARCESDPPPTGLAPVARGILHYGPSDKSGSAESREPPTQGRWGEGQGASHSPLFSWPIDTNLATWVTTLSINALGDDVPLDARPGLRAWLLRQQYRVVHPYTQAAPGGWAWTDLPGGVPDGDDTPGAMLALINLERSERAESGWHARVLSGEPGGVSPQSNDEHVRGLTPSGSPNISEIDGRSSNEESLAAATSWLLTLQNRDGGWPTFCRGWGTLPFDRSSQDITAHAIRASSMILNSWRERLGCETTNRVARNVLEDALREVSRPVERGLKFLKKSQRPDGSWLPLWFGNQHAPNDENPTYGTAKVLAAFQALGRMSDESAVRGVRWLVENQNPDGGWGAGAGTPSSVEETALALEALLGAREETGKRRTENGELETEGETSHSRFSVLGSSLPGCLTRGLSWLIPRVEDGRFREPSPIGFYFAKLWYFEALYPLIFTVAALRKAAAMCENDQ